MKWTQIVWDDSPGGNVEHVEEHDLTTDDVEYVLANPASWSASRATGRPCAFGYAQDGRYVIVVYEEIDEDTIVPVTAFEVPGP